MLPEKLCHTEKIAPGTVAIGNIAKWVAASEVARPEFCIHLQRLEVETICAVVLTCDGDVLDEERWGAGVVEQVSLAMKLEFPDADGFSMYYTQGGEENTMFFRIGSKKRDFLPIMHRSVAIMSGDSADLWFITLFSCPQKVIGCLRLGWSYKPNDVERVWRYVKLNFVVLWGE